MLCSIAVTTASASDYSDSVHTLYNAGTAVSSGTYVIYDQDDMDAFVSYVNAGRNTSGVTFKIDGTGKTYTVTSEIAVPTISSNATTSSPYVSGGTGFAGVFDGNGNTLSVTISTTASGSGLFGYIAPSGEVEDLTVTGSVTVTGSHDAVGGIAGYNSGVIYDVVSTVGVTASSAYNVGGIAGFNNNYYGTSPKGVISTCECSGTIQGYNKVGGIAGENAGTVSQCKSSAAVTGSNTSSKNGVGGIVGRNGNNNTAYETGYVVNSYFSGGSVGSSGQKWVGGIAGFNNALSKVSTCYVKNCTITGLSYRNTIVGNQEGTSQYNYVAADGTVYTNSGSTAAEIGTTADAATMLTGLNTYSRALASGDTTTYAIWATGTTYPVLSMTGDYFLENAVSSSDTNDYATNNNCSVIYLSNGASDSFTLTGQETSVTVGSPYVAAKLAAYSSVSACYVSVLNTITISGAISPIFDNVTFKWGGTSGGTMFNINAAAGSLTIAGATIDGNNTCSTLFDVDNGTLKLRGSSVTENCTYAVNLASGATFNLSRATIGGTVYLASGAYITVVYALSSTINVTSADTASDTIIAACQTNSIASTAVTYLSVNSGVDLYQNINSVFIL